MTEKNGNQLLNREVQSAFEQLNIASQPQGIYLLRIVSGDALLTKKVIKR